MSGLPTGWAMATVDDVTLPIAVVDPRVNPDNTFTYVDIGSIDNRSNRIADPKSLLGRDAPSRARQRLRVGDTVFSTVRTYLRNIAFIDSSLSDAIGSTGFAVLRPAQGIHSRFLYYYSLTNAFVNGLSAQMRGTSYPAVVDGQVRAMAIPIPPTAEQSRIVAAIEEQFSRLDAGAAGLARARANLKQMRSAVFHTVVHADEAEPDSIARWPTLRVGDLTRVTSGATPARGNRAYWQGGTIPWVTSTLVNQESITSTREFITDLAVKETSVKLMPVGTLLVAMYGEGQTRGRCSELLVEATTNQACAAIVVNPESACSPAYLKLYFKASYEANRLLSVGGVQPNLSIGKIKNLRIAVPPIGEQIHIVSRTTERIDAIDRLMDQVDNLTRRQHTLRSTVLAAAFSGRLVPQDPSDEPAAMVLERIAATRVSANRPRPTSRRHPRAARPKVPA